MASSAFFAGKPGQQCGDQVRKIQMVGDTGFEPVTSSV